jgi:lipopolysaccharide transport system permease protein
MKSASQISIPLDQPKEEWDLVIKPRTRLLDIDLGELWRYRDLMLLFVRRDFIAQYKQTVLGPLWHFIQPILTTMMFLMIFGRIARIPTDGVHPIVFYMSGITLWNYFSQCLTSTSNTFIQNAGIFGKVYFPRLIMPAAVIISNIIRLGIQFILLVIVIVWFHFHGYPFTFNMYLLLIPCFIFLMAGIAFGLGIMISSVTTKYRDFAVLLTFIVQLLMYATPIVYPLSYVESLGYGWIIRLNPLTPVVEAFRYAIFQKGMFSGFDLAYSFGFMVFVLLAGVLLFNKVEKSFVDTV